MTDKAPKTAIFPGTFDPMTNGHLDVIRRGAAIFDELIVAVGDNPDKASMLSQDKRTAILAETVADVPNVRVEKFTGLTIDAAKRLGADVILRGLRGSADFHYEYPMAQTNRQVAGIDTVFILAAPEHAFVSSGLIKQIAREGGDVSSLVPPQVLPHLSRPTD